MDRQRLLARIWDAVDPRLRAGLAGEYARRPRAAGPLPLARVALVGHRAAGKTRLLPPLAEWCGLPGVDLDLEIAARTGRTPREWFAADRDGFRAEERRHFQALEPPVLIATGGGFLSNHADLLAGVTAVLVPVTWETYRERLLVDRERPRLRPELPLAEEIRRVYAERERRHALVETLPLVEFLARAESVVAARPVPESGP